MAGHKIHLKNCRKKSKCTCYLDTSNIKKLTNKTKQALNKDRLLIRQKLSFVGIRALENIICNNVDHIEVHRQLIVLRDYWLNRETNYSQAQKILESSISYIDGR